MTSVVILTFCGVECIAQVRHRNVSVSGFSAETQVSDSILIDDIAYLSDSLCAGRGSYSRGIVEASYWISKQFRNIGIKPFDGRYTQSFLTDGKIGRNIAGIISGGPSCLRDKYIIVGAHYDNVGVLNGTYYPGADSNASGVSAMLSLARMFKAMTELGRSYQMHIIFVAFDAKQLSMAGSRNFAEKIASGRLTDPFTGKTIRKENIFLMVNLDILGSTLVPFNKGREDYMLALGLGNSYDSLSSANISYGTWLDLSPDYYGSKDFTDLFLNRISDQKAFMQFGIRSVMFTSGITMNTNNKKDVLETLDIPILKRRICLIFHWLETMTSER